MIDLKVFNSALSQLEEERGIPKEKILEAIEQALAAAYKKDYGKKGQIVRARFDTNTGAAEFTQVKIVVDESVVRMPEEDADQEEKRAAYIPDNDEEEFDTRPRFNPEHHILIDDARKIKKALSLRKKLFSRWKQKRTTVASPRKRQSRSSSRKYARRKRQPFWENIPKSAAKS